MTAIALLHRPVVDVAEIARALALLIEPGQVTELRALEVASGRWTTNTASGYFDDMEKLAADAAGLSGRAKGVYVVYNAVDPALLARAVNRVRQQLSKTDLSTADHDISRRLVLPIDLDVKRPAGISSTDEEHEAAIRCALAVRDALCGSGWPEPVVADSGNGAHLLYRIDLPPDDGGLVQRVLAAIRQLVSEPTISVDQTLYNPARILRLYGTLARKGDDTPERPHRIARILEAPDTLTVVSRDLLEHIAGQLVSPVLTSRLLPPLSGSAFSIDEWVRTYLPDADGPDLWNASDGAARRWVLPACPFNSDHTNKSAFVAELASGAIVAGCHHDGCSGKDWHALRALLEPGHVDASRIIVTVNGNGRQGHSERVVSGEGDVETVKPSKLYVSLRDLESDPDLLRPPEAVVPYFAWRERTSLLAAREKDGKSTLGGAGAAAVSAGRDFLGQSVPQGAVLILALEEHAGDLVRRLKTMGADSDKVFVCQHLPNGLASLEEMLKDLAPRLTIVDALASAVERLIKDSRESASWTPIMNGLGRLTRTYKTAMLLLHHARKSDGQYRDSSAIGAGVDMILEMGAGSEEQPTVRKIRAKGRWALPNFAVRYEEGVYGLVTAGEVSLDAKVLEYIRANPGASKTNARAAGGAASSSVDTALAKLENNGFIIDRLEGSAHRYYVAPAAHVAKRQSGLQSGGADSRKSLSDMTESGLQSGDLTNSGNHRVVSSQGSGLLDDEELEIL